VRVALLMSDTGGGHRAAARAIEAGLRRLDPSGSVEIRDGLVEGTTWPLRRAPAIYAWCMRHARWLWGLSFHLWNGPRRARWMVDLGFPFVGRRLARFLAGVEADVIVSVHPLLTRSVLRALDTGPTRPPFAVVVTDLVTGHWSWYEPGVDLFLVPTEEARATMQRGGIALERILVCGQPVHPRCGEAVPRRLELRARYGWVEPVILFVGGGDGTGDLGRRVRAAARARLPARLVVVCGRNARLEAELRAERFQVPVEVHGFVDDLPELMAAADILVTKGGPGSIMEGCVAGLPMIIYDHIPGQERGNVDLVLGRGMGFHAPRPGAMVHQLRTWLADPEARARAAASARSFARPRSAVEIAEAVLALGERAPARTGG
jgi:1,2-diacylglycerol 3-beta-galactosyltransferase